MTARTGSKTTTPMAVLMELKAKAFRWYIPTLWATKAMPQTVAVIKSRSTPNRLLFFICITSFVFLVLARTLVNELIVFEIVRNYNLFFYGNRYKILLS